MSRLRISRKRRKFAWTFGASAIVIALLYWEQAAVIYVLSTLVVCAVLLVVMFSNLEARDRELQRRKGEEVVHDEYDGLRDQIRRRRRRGLSAKQLWARKISLQPAKQTQVKA